VIEAIRFSGDITTEASGRVAVLPVGSVEYHGPHGYLGVDSLIADRVARAVADALDAILLPRVDYTWCSELNRPYPGTIAVPQAVMQDYYAAILDGVLAWGVRGVLALCGHDGNLAPMSVAADRVGPLHPQRFVLAVNWWETWPEADSAARFGFTELGGHGHGGPLEMSAAWAANPGGVHPERAADVSLAGEPERTVRVLHHAGRRPRWEGYHGRPSEADPAAGEALLGEAAARIAADVRDYVASLDAEA
jgi:creatinine amidohydrolase